MNISEREREIIESAPVDIYIASNMPYEYPYKLFKPKHISQNVVDSADNIILDSGIGDDLSNKKVLKTAEEHGVDFVVAKDYLHDIEKTTDSINEFWNIYHSGNYDCEAIIPLQPPHTEHYKELNSPSKVMIGGVKDESVPNQIEYVEDFVSEYDVDHLHLLGGGMSQRMVKWIRENPHKIDSLDCSTPEQAVINNKIADANLLQTNYETCKGEKSSVMRYKMAQVMAVQLNYLIGPYLNTEKLSQYKNKDDSNGIFDY